MPRIILIAALLLLVGGCEENISPEEYKELSARADTIEALQDTIEATIRGIMSYIPCPPCPPDTVAMMPPGRWVKKEEFYKEICRPRHPVPDSVYILKGE